MRGGLFAIDYRVVEKTSFSDQWSSDMGSIRNYERLVKETINLATNFSLELENASRKRIETVVLCTGYVDNYIDFLASNKNSGNIDETLGAFHVLNYLKTGSPDSFKTVSNSFGMILGTDPGDEAPHKERFSLYLRGLREILCELPDCRREQFFDCVQRIFKCGKKLNSEKEPLKFVEVRKVEAISTAGTVLVLVDELRGEKSEEEALKIKNFERMYRYYAVGSNWWDSIKDYREDRKSGEIAAPPEVILGLASATLAIGVKAVAQHPRRIDFAWMVAGYMARSVGRHLRFSF